MLQFTTIMYLWELYNYYSMLSLVYNSYYYARIAAYYSNKLYSLLSGNYYYEPPETNIQLTTFTEDGKDAEGWEIIDII